MGIHGPTPVGPNEQTFIPLEREKQPAASSSPGLAGTKSGFSYARREKSDDTPREVDLGETFKAFDLVLQDGAQSGLNDGHVKSASVPNGNYIGFMPHVHYKLTYDAAIEAGFTPAKADELAKLVVHVDDLPESQAPKNSCWHSMRAPGETMPQYWENSRIYESQCWKKRSMDGLAGLLHRMQDGCSKSHVGPDGPIPWHGFWGENPFTLLWHGLEDMAPSPDTERYIVGKAALLIKDYNNLCGRSLGL